MVRGVRTEELTEAENVLVFGGISAHVAPLRGFQDENLEMVTCTFCYRDLQLAVLTLNLVSQAMSPAKNLDQARRRTA